MKHLILLLVSTLLIAESPVNGQDSDTLLLSIDNLFESRFSAKSFGPASWSGVDASYTVIESNEIVRYDAESGERTVIVPGKRLIPPGESSPIRINSYSFTDNYSHVLIYTNVKSEGQGPAGGDYWVLDLLLWTWHKLGGDSPPHSLRNAQFSPDGKKVSYIKDNNIYTENLRSFIISQLTSDGNEKIRNGQLKSAATSMVGRTLSTGRSPRTRSQAQIHIIYPAISNGRSTHIQDLTHLHSIA